MVQAGALGRAQRAVDRALDQRVREAELLALLAQQPGVDRVLERVQPVPDASEAGRERERRARAEHGGRGRQPARRRGRAVEPRDDQLRERARHRQRPSGLVPRSRGQLVQQRQRVQRVALRVRMQPRGAAGRQLDALRRGDLLQLGRRERREPEHAAAMLGEPPQARGHAVDVVVAGGDEHEHLVGHEPARGEQQRLERRGVGPVGVVDDDDHRTARPQPAERGQQAQAGAHVVGGGLGAEDGVAGCAQDLVGDAVGQRRLGLLAAAAQHARRAGAAQEVVQQRGLADAGGPGQQHDARVAVTRFGKPTVERRDLVAPTDEQLPLLQHVHPAPSLASGVPEVNGAGAAAARSGRGERAPRGRKNRGCSCADLPASAEGSSLAGGDARQFYAARRPVASGKPLRRTGVE